MNYYIVSEETGGVLDIYFECQPTQEQLEQAAQGFKCSVYVIEGQRRVMTAEYQPPAPGEE